MRKIQQIRTDVAKPDALETGEPNFRFGQFPTEKTALTQFGHCRMNDFNALGVGRMAAQKLIARIANAIKIFRA